jgi:hypothetical protein
MIMGHIVNACITLKMYGTLIFMYIPQNRLRIFPYEYLKVLTLLPS